MTQSFLLILPLLFILLWISVIVINKLVPIPVPEMKYKSIDGVRGYLALFVMLHHCWNWHAYLRGKSWTAPEEFFVRHMGQAAVAIFFMITAFLFANRLLENKEIDWKQYFKARWFRLAPVYYFSVLVIFILAFTQTGFVLNTSISEFFVRLAAWLAFTIPGAVTINGFQETNILNSSVTWSLVYEWLFYLSLPIIAPLFKRKTQFLYVLIGLTGVIAIILLYKPMLSYCYPFISGIIAALLLRNESIKSRFQSPWLAVISLIIIGYLINNVPSAYKIPSLLGYTFVFLCIAANNSFFGALHHKLSLQFGQITYSVYLLHGLVLFCFFTFANVEIRNFEPWEHWLFVAGIIPFVVLISQLAYKYIERPGIALGKKKLWNKKSQNA